MSLLLATSHPYTLMLLGAALAAPVGFLAGVVLERRWWRDRLAQGAFR